MKKDTRTKILSALNITLGAAICFMMLRVIQVGASGILSLLVNVPAVEWTMKHTFEGFIIIFLSTIVAWLGFTIGVGSINLGIKRLKFLVAAKDLDKLLGEMKGRIKKSYKEMEDEEDKAIQNEKEQTKRFYEK